MFLLAIRTVFIQDTQRPFSPGAIIRVAFLFAAILVCMLSPAAGLDDVTAAATAWNPLATLDDPDVEQVGPKGHLIAPHADPILPPCCLPQALLVLVGQVLLSRAPRASQATGLSLRIPRAPPVG